MATSVPTVLFSAHKKHHNDWLPALRKACADAGADIELIATDTSPEDVDYIVYSPDGPVHDFSHFTNLRAIFSIWAGVENIAGNQSIKVPLTRMVDPGMIQGMKEWVSGQVLRHHLGLDRHIGNSSGSWLHHLSPPIAPNRTVGMLGLGQLGGTCARTLSNIGFRVIGWSKSPKDLHGVDCRFGTSGLESTLAEAEILVLLVPKTGETENLLDARNISRLRPGAVVINPGRGALIDDNALLAALDSEQISHATLDVFREEPLPPQHPFWEHPRVTISPHIAAETRVETASPVVAENIRRALLNEPFLHVVDRGRGY